MNPEQKQKRAKRPSKFLHWCRTFGHPVSCHVNICPDLNRTDERVRAFVPRNKNV